MKAPEMLCMLKIQGFFVKHCNTKAGVLHHMYSLIIVGGGYAL